jgi:hypothetical protein
LTGKYIIQYCRDSVTRAKNAMQEDTLMWWAAFSIYEDFQQENFGKKSGGFYKKRDLKALILLD